LRSKKTEKWEEHVKKLYLMVAVALFAAAGLGAPGGVQAYDGDKVVTVQGSPTVYLALANGPIYPFVNPETFLGCGFKWTDVVTVQQEWLDYAFRLRMFPLSDVPTCEMVRGLRPIPKAAVERAPVMVDGRPEVYYVLPDGTKHLIASANALLGCGFRWSGVQKISSKELEAMNTGIALPDATACRTARRLSFAVLTREGEGAPQGVGELLDNIVSIPGQEEIVYFVTGWGIRHKFSNPEAFLGCGFLSGNVKQVSPLALFYLVGGPSLDTAADCKVLRD
jgi:hypothetical protein